MSIRTRVAALERRLELMTEEDFGPVTIIEALHGTRDEARRRRLGREGCRLAAEKLRNVLDESRRDCPQGEGSSSKTDDSSKVNEP